jgi:hypothetical protein
VARMLTRPPLSLVFRSSTLAMAAVAFGACSANPGDGPVSSSSVAIISQSSAISRASEWVDAKLHYCQSSYDAPDGDRLCWAFEGPAHRCDRESNAQWNAYRSDCSGFVTWAWGLPPVGDGGYVTGDFAPFNTSFSHSIDGEDLQPGDACNKDDKDHIVLFKQWLTPGHTAVFMEEPGCGSSMPYAHEFTSNVSISGSSIFIDYEGASFTAIRFDGISSAPPPVPVPSDEIASPIGINQDGRLEAFARWTDGSARHDWQKTPGQSWAGWSDLGGKLTNPVALRNKDGRLEVFARGTGNAVWHAWQTKAGEAWSDWASLGGDAAGAVAAAVNQDGRVEVFVRWSDNTLRHIWQTTAGGSWSTWASLDGELTHDPVVARNTDGRLEVFARGSGTTLLHNWETTPNGFDGWNGWSSMGGDLTSNVAVGQNQDGRLELFAPGSDGGLSHAWQVTAGGHWSDWASLGGKTEGDASVGKNQDGRLEVFVGGKHGTLQHAWQIKGGAWSDWATLGDGVTGDPAVALNQDGRLEVFIRSSKGALLHDWQTKPGTSWNGLASLGGALEF